MITQEDGAERLRDRQKAFREDTIMRAAAGLLAEVGCDILTMEQVARRLGTSKAVLYRHFESKDELLTRALSQAARATLDELRSRAEGAPEEGRLRTAARALVQNWMGLTDPDPAATAVPCCLTKVVCPYATWTDFDALFTELGAERERIALSLALRALSAVAVQRLRAENQQATSEDVEAVLHYLFPEC